MTNVAILGEAFKAVDYRSQINELLAQHAGSIVDSQLTGWSGGDVLDGRVWPIKHIPRAIRREPPLDMCS